MFSGTSALAQDILSDFGWLFGGGTERMPGPSISAEQRRLLEAVGRWALGEALDPTAYEGQLTAPAPGMFMDAYREYEEERRAPAIGGAIQDLIGGVPAYTFDPAEATSRWKETYAGPVMETWRETVLPSIEESLNIPGVMYSRKHPEVVGKEASAFYGQYVAPSLFTALQTGEQMGFQSGEAAAARRPAALNLPFQQAVQGFGVSGALQEQWQKPLTALYQEFVRQRQYALGAAGIAAGVGAAPTMDWGMWRTPSILEQLAPIAMGAAGMAM